MASNIDAWTGVTNWLAFVPVAGFVAWYYWPASDNRKPGHASPANRKQYDRESKAGTPRREESAQASGRVASSATRKGGKKPRPEAHATPAVHVQSDEPEKEDMSTHQFVEQMMKAKQGTNLSAPKSKEQRVKTVKQGSALSTPVLSSGSSQTGADATADISPAPSAALRAGDVSDMLEPAPAAPSTLRLTASKEPTKQKAPRPKKEDTALTKKQRQNKQKKEAERQEREKQEQQRKVLEEQQRRMAREARGEPAKNGIPVSNPPATSAWTAPKPAQRATESAAPAVNGTSHAPLLDTFDAESTASSDGKASTAATSTTEAEPTQRDWEAYPEEGRKDNIDVGWTTVSVPKKQKKKAADEVNHSHPAEPKPVAKTAPPVIKPTVRGEPNGFMALNDRYEQRTDVDPADASNWDA